MRRWAGRLLEPVSLTEAGRPVLRAGEVECQLLDRVDIQCCDQRLLSGNSGAEEDVLRSGLLILTNARLVWVHQQSRSGFSLPLCSISRISAPKKSLKTVFSTPRLRLEVWTSANGKVCVQGAAGVDSSTSLALLLRGSSSYDVFAARLSNVVESRAWEALPPPPAVASSSSTTTTTTTPTTPTTTSVASSSSASNWNPSRAGVSGILRKEQEQWEEADKNLQEAFHDLNALMGKAKEMVLLADKLHAKVLNDDDLGSNKQEIQDWLLSVGIASPVTKESAGALYHQQLSRQLADFVWVPLQRAGGMLAVVDVYCLFNRARGTELISPEDLLQACELWDRLDVPVTMRRFDSGALAIQIKSRSDDEVFSKIMLLVERPENSRYGIGASDAAKCLGVAPALAKEHLIAAEYQGLLCRDDGADGLRFFANFFKNAQMY